MVLTHSKLLEGVGRVPLVATVTWLNAFVSEAVRAGNLALG